jgi:hypothetical protein
MDLNFQYDFIMSRQSSRRLRIEQLKITKKNRLESNTNFNMTVCQQVILATDDIFTHYVPYLNIVEMHCFVICDKTDPHGGFFSSFILG